MTGRAAQINPRARGAAVPRCALSRWAVCTFAPNESGLRIARPTGGACASDEPGLSTWPPARPLRAGPSGRWPGWFAQLALLDSLELHAAKNAWQHCQILTALSRPARSHRRRICPATVPRGGRSSAYVANVVLWYRIISYTGGADEGGRRKNGTRAVAGAMSGATPAVARARASERTRHRLLPAPSCSHPCRSVRQCDGARKRPA